MATRAAPIGVRALTGCPPVGMVPPTMEESDAVSRRRPDAFGQAAMRGPFECRVRYYRWRLGAVARPRTPVETRLPCRFDRPGGPGMPWKPRATERRFVRKASGCRTLAAGPTIRSRHLLTAIGRDLRVA